MLKDDTCRIKMRTRAILKIKEGSLKSSSYQQVTKNDRSQDLRKAPKFACETILWRVVVAATTHG